MRLFFASKGEARKREGERERKGKATKRRRKRRRKRRALKQTKINSQQTAMQTTNQNQGAALPVLFLGDHGNKQKKNKKTGRM
jgi:hypothetical protein